ncbi:MAG: hypothetical protein ACI4I5_08550 [Acutalibacteraceae bacterium]
MGKFICVVLVLFILWKIHRANGATLGQKLDDCGVRFRRFLRRRLDRMDARQGREED